MSIPNHTPTMQTLQCEGALSDLILQAARQAIPPYVGSLILLPDCGVHNNPLMPLLLGLLDAALVTAKAIEDNACDNQQAINNDLAIGVAATCESIFKATQNATEVS